MKDKKVLFVVALITMVVTALITSMIIINRDNNNEEIQPTLTVTPTNASVPSTIQPTISVSVSPSVSTIPTASITETPTETVRSYNNFAEFFSPDLYIFVPDYCINSNSGCEHYEINANDVIREDHKSILDIAKNAFPVADCAGQLSYGPNYALIANEKVFEHAEPGNISFYILKDFDIFINAEYQGKDDIGGNFKSYIFKVYSKCSTETVYTISESYESDFPILKSLSEGDIVALSGVFGGGGAAAGTTYFEIQKDLRIEIF